MNRWATLDNPYGIHNPYGIDNDLYGIVRTLLLLVTEAGEWRSRLHKPINKSPRPSREAPTDSSLLNSSRIPFFNSKKRRAIARCSICLVLWWSPNPRPIRQRPSVRISQPPR